MGVVEGGEFAGGEKTRSCSLGRWGERESGEVGKKRGKGRLNDSVWEAEWQGDAETLGVHVWV